MLKKIKKNKKYIMWENIEKSHSFIFLKSSRDYPTDLEYNSNSFSYFSK